MNRPDARDVFDQLGTWAKRLCAAAAPALTRFGARLRRLARTVVCALRKLGTRFRRIRTLTMPALGLVARHKQVAIPLVLVLTCALVGTAYAWITASGSLSNVFGVGQVTPGVTETLDGLVKSEVKVTNNGNTAAYVRAQVNIYWQDDDGNQLWDAPVADTNYTITYPSDSSWTQGGDGFYYYPSAVAAGDSTTNLIDKVEQTTAQRSTDSTAGHHLVVDISTQMIQADPTDAVTSAWPVTVDESGTLSYKAAS